MNNFILAFCLVISSCLSADPYLSWGKTEETMRNFRSFSDVLADDRLNPVGVAGRNISGSGQFSSDNLEQLAPYVHAVSEVDKIIVVDLRLESHAFINTAPVAWKVKHNNANLGKSVDEIINDETERLELLTIAGEVEGYPIYFVDTEAELAKRNGLEYVRLPILDHSHPNDERVDDIMALLKNNPNSWLHVHCAVGKGRTTLFLAMFDIYHNAKEVSFDEILERQKAIGGQDFQKYLHHPHKDSYKQNLYLDRLAFLEQFYQFCCQEEVQDLSWSEYLKKSHL